MRVMSESIEIETSDGRMGAHLARPADGDGPFPAVVVVMEAFGLNRHIKGVAERIAAEGYVALAPDVYYREPDRVAEYGDLPKALALMGKLRDADVLADMRAVLDHLGSRPDVRPGAIGMTGFCMGGRISFLCATALPLKAAVCFYGGGIGGLLDRAGGISCPIVLLFGERDGFIPLSEVEAIRERLAELGKQAEVVVYPGADHGFFCDERPSYHEEAARDAWRRLKEHFSRHLGR